MEVIFEQNVSNPNIDKHRKRTKFLSVLRYILLAIGILAAFILLMLGQVKSWTDVLIVFVFALLSLAPGVASFILLGMYLNRTNSEYDYSLHGSVLRIVRITRRTKRKLMSTIYLDAVDSIGKINSESYNRFSSSKELKKQYAICDYEDEDKLIYIKYRSEGEDFLLHFEPNDEMIKSLRLSLPRMSIMDKSMTAPIVPKK